MQLVIDRLQRRDRLQIPPWTFVMSSCALADHRWYSAALVGRLELSCEVDLISNGRTAAESIERFLDLVRARGPPRPQPVAVMAPLELSE